MPTPTVLVAVPTTGSRSTLFELIDFLDTNRRQPGGAFDACLIVNAARVPDGVKAAAEAAGIEVVHVPRPGLAQARNAALTAAAAYEFLIFVDDDEMPGPHWPSDLIAAATDALADVAMGAIVGRIEGEVPWWLTGPELFRPTITSPAGRYAGEVYSSNTLVRMNMVTESGLRFDEDFDYSGAEDTDFFRRCRTKGASIIWVPESMVTETIDADRLRLSAYLRRSASESAVLWILEGRPEANQGRSRVLTRRLGRAIRGLGRCVGGVATLNTARVVSGLNDIAISYGTVAAAVGWHPAGYGERVPRID